MHPQGRKKIGDKKTAIYDCAKSLFSSNGFKNTNVPDITKMAGIAAGTFYLYYPSKEDLFIEIFMDENMKLKKKNHELVNMDGDPMTVIQEITRLNMIGMQSNPILREWYNREVFNKIESKYREKHGEDQFDFLYDFYYEVIKKWQVDGKMRSDIDTRMIWAIFGAIINIDTHKDEIGVEFFPEIMDHLIDFVMKALTIHPDQAGSNQKK